MSLVWGGLDLGSVIGLLIAPSIISRVGWQAVFYIFAVLGFMWCASGVWLGPSPLASAFSTAPVNHSKVAQQPPNSGV